MVSPNISKKKFKLMYRRTRGTGFDSPFSIMPVPFTHRCYLYIQPFQGEQGTDPVHLGCSWMICRKSIQFLHHLPVKQIDDALRIVGIVF